MLLRSFIVSISAALCLIAAPGALAQTDYPTKPIRLIVGFAPGGAADVLARTIDRKSVV